MSDIPAKLPTPERTAKITRVDGFVVLYADAPTTCPSGAPCLAKHPCLPRGSWCRREGQQSDPHWKPTPKENI
jgi:hypothetical protein